jgi:sugar lactone lactonase YvrE
MHAYYTRDSTALKPDDPERELTKLASNGRVLWRQQEGRIMLLGVDPQTQNVWIRGGEVFGMGRIRVLDREGKQIAQRRDSAGTIGFVERDQSVWIAAGKVSRMDRSGRLAAQAPFAIAAWDAPRISVNDTDGSIWVSERLDRQVPGSAGRLWVVAADGSIVRKVETPWRTGPVVLDPPRGVAWQETGGGIQRIAIKDGQPIGDVVPIGGSMCVEPDTGCVWIAGQEGVARVAPDGRPIWFHSTASDTYKALVIVPAT